MKCLAGGGREKDWIRDSKNHPLNNFKPCQSRTSEIVRWVIGQSQGGGERVEEKNYDSAKFQNINRSWNFVKLGNDVMGVLKMDVGAGTNWTQG